MDGCAPSTCMPRFVSKSSPCILSATWHAKLASRKSETISFLEYSLLNSTIYHFLVTTALMDEHERTCIGMDRLDEPSLRRKSKKKVGRRMTPRSHGCRYLGLAFERNAHSLNVIQIRNVFISHGPKTDDTVLFSLVPRLHHRAFTVHGTIRGLLMYSCAIMRTN